jgi:hypothetical protein
VKKKAHDRLSQWFDEDEITDADDLFKDDPVENPV